MTIGIDARLWNQTGVGRYIRNLTLNLLDIDKENSYVLFVRALDRDEIESQISKFKIKNLKLEIVIANIAWHSLKEQLNFPKIIDKENVDVMHFTYQQSVPIFYKKPYVITIHDLIKHHYITGRSSTNPYWLLGFKMIAYKTLINIGSKNANKIIAVSQSTRDEIVDHLTVNKRNIDVIYEGVDDFKISKPGKNEIGDYFLFVGNVFQHKNTNNLIKAFKKVIEAKDVKLVFLGRQDYFLEKLKKDVKKLIDSNQIMFIESASDSEMATLYKNSICLIRPSFMEGFSLPPLEAFESGTLALVSDIPVHKEILKDFAIYFNPRDFVDMESKMNYVLSLDKKKREAMIKNGKNLADKFSWKKTAEETLKVYENIFSLNSI